NRFFSACKRMYDIRTRKDSCYIFYISLMFSFATIFCPLNVFLNFRFLFRSSKRMYYFTFTSENHKANSEYSIRTCSEDFKFPAIFKLEEYCGTYTFTNPVTLHFFKRIAPFKTV